MSVDCQTGLSEKDLVLGPKCTQQTKVDYQTGLNEKGLVFGRKSKFQISVDCYTGPSKKMFEDFGRLLDCFERKRSSFWTKVDIID